MPAAKDWNPDDVMLPADIRGRLQECRDNIGSIEARPTRAALSSMLLTADCALADAIGTIDALTQIVQNTRDHARRIMQANVTIRAQAALDKHTLAIIREILAPSQHNED